MIQAIEARRDFVLSNFRVLRRVDPNDHYWRSFANLDQYRRDGRIFETGMVISWIGSEYRPRRILEIGTRTGGSLISLLSTYDSFEGVEVLSFDLWREYFSVTWLSRVLTRLMGSKDGTSQVNVSQRFMRPFSGLIKWLSTGKVRRNLRAFNLPTDMIRFISGDSRQTVPAWMAAHPGAQFDYVLVDGAHDEETARIDLENVVDYVAPGGFLVFDDIGPEGYKLGQVWDAFKAAHADKFDFFEVYHRKGVAWAIRKG